MKNKVYELIDVNKELPTENCKVGIIKNGEFDFAYFIRYNDNKNHTFDHYKQGLHYNQNEITHWLKEQNNKYILSEEELLNIIGNAFDAGRLKGNHDGNYFDTPLNKEQYINQILNK